MKILHGPHNPANQAFIVSRAQRRLGHRADVALYKANPYYPKNFDYNLKIKKSAIGFAKVANFLLKKGKNYDIFHYYYSTFFPTRYFQNLDMKILSKFNKRVLMNFQGCDIRIPGNNPICNSCQGCSNTAEKIDFLKNSRKYANALVVSTPDLLEFVPEAEYVPQAIDLDFFRKQPSRKHKQVRILHCPTDRNIKGTEYVSKAIEELQGEGLDIVLEIAEGKTQKQLIESYKEADIVVDQLLVGWYGLVSVEAMATGRPVICYINPKLKKYAKGCPIVNATPQTLKTQIKRLVERPKLIKELGWKGREYVEKIHSSQHIAKRFLELYM